MEAVDSVTQTRAPGPVESVSVLVGNRLCIRCGYNLVGQSVYREPHYGLHVARCPECGTVTALQEYPLLGRWAARWGAVLVVLWFITLLGMWAATSASIFGFSLGTAEESTRSYRGYLSERMEADTAAQAAAPQVITYNIGGTIVRTNTSSTNVAAWWQQQDPPAVLADAGGWAAAVDWTAFWIWLPGGLVTFTFGWFWAVALLQVRRRWLALWSLPLAALCMVFVAIQLQDWSAGSSLWLGRIAARQLGPRVLLLSVAFAQVPLILGMVLGRPLTRLLIRALLPPRMRGSLTVLWTADGLLPPAAAWTARRRAEGRAAPLAHEKTAPVSVPARPSRAGETSPSLRSSY